MVMRMGLGWTAGQIFQMLHPKCHCDALWILKWAWRSEKRQSKGSLERCLQLFDYVTYIFNLSGHVRGWLGLTWTWCLRVVPWPVAAAGVFFAYDLYAVESLAWTTWQISNFMLLELLYIYLDGCALKLRCHQLATERLKSAPYQPLP